MQTQLPSNRTGPGGLKQATAYLRRRAGTAVTLLGVLALSVFVASCGDGGGSGGGEGASLSSQAVTGVAATGSPLVGKVTLRDSSPERRDKEAAIGADGSFAIDVSDMRAPFILKADGTADGISHKLYSFADKAGIANINPLSTAALANAADVDDPEEAFEKSDSDKLEKIKSAMPGSVATLQAKLKPLLDVFSVANTNPVKDSFSADHNGLDAVFDNVKVVIAAGTLTITNVDTGTVLFTARIRDIASGRFTDRDDDLPRHAPRPAAPTGVTTVGGPALDQVTVSWDPVAGATSYDLFYTTKSKAAEDDDHEGEDSKKRVRNVTSPFVVSGLDASTTYFFIVRARIDGRKGPRSAEVSGTPSSMTPSSTTTTTTTSTTAGSTTTTAPATTTTAPATTTTAATTTTTAPATTTTAPATTTTAPPTTTTAAPTTTTTAPPTTTTTVPLPPPTTTTSTSTTTTTTATTTTTTLPGLNGWAIYDAYCSACHGATGKVGRTAAQISSAISSNRGSMGMLVSTGGCDSCHAIPPSTTGPLSAAQIAAIAARTLPRP